MFSYKYYDTPDGQDICKKTFVTSKYAALTGLTLASYDVLMFSHPKGVFNTGYRYMWFIAPMVGMASAFTITSNVAQNIRGKNDKINYFLGGVAAGSVFGAWQRSVTAAVPMAVLLGVAAMVKKDAVDNGWVFFPDITYAAETVRSARNDWTIVKDIDELKTWTTGTK